MKNLFVYGTLMCDDIMREVAGCNLTYVPGTLNGYRRRSVQGEHYPAIAPEKEGQVEGLVYLNVPDFAWDRLDRFEGEMYTRHLVQIKLSNGATLVAGTYVIKPEFIDRLDKSDWDFKNFLKNGKEIFQEQYKGYQSLK